MKTVMKKMFCLLLVAVLLVGVMPFQAFASTFTVEFQVQYPDGTLVVYPHSHSGDSFRAHDFLNFYVSGWSDAYAIDQVWMNGSPVAEDTITPADDNCAMGVVLTDKHIHSYSVATCTTPGTCSCGATNSVDPNNHNYSEWSITTPATCIAAGIKSRTCSRDANHTEAVTIPVDSNAHNFSGGKCTLCNTCEHCGNIGSHPENCKYYCNGTTNCPNDPTVASAHTAGCLKTKCNKNGCTKDYNHEGECSVPCTKKAGCILKQNHAGACDTHCEDTHCDFDYGHDGKHSYQCPEDGCDKAVDHDGKHSNEPNYASGSHKLKVYARIWVHETKYDTIPLDTITGLSGDAKIYQVIAANKDHLNAILPYDKFKALHWSETVNYLNDDKEYKDVGTSMTVSDENEVYVNLYSAEQLIVVNVHTSKTWAYDISVRIEGFRPGDLVTYEDVLKAVKKYYNVSSMKMFTYEEMCDYLEGGKADQIENFIAGEKDDPYEVFISGSRKSGSYKYTADSTNPKTGDEIFVPMAVLGLSASALAVMFYLNKKRAY